MRALVTGGTGFVGSHLIDALLERGDTVTALVRSRAKGRPLGERGVRLVHGDLHDPRALAEAVQGQEAIFHLAGLVAARNRAEFDRTNLEGCRNLVEASVAAEGRPRFVLVSSLAAQGPATRGHPLGGDGDREPHPVTDYGRSKLAGEQVVRASELPWTILRPPMVYGPRDTEVFKVFKLARWGLAPVFGDGSQELSAVTGIDLARALIAVVAPPEAEGRTYYPCHPVVFTSAEFARAVGRAVGRRVVIPRLPQWLARGALVLTEAGARLAGRATLLTRDKANEFFQPAWTGDPEPLTRDTGWRADHDLTTGLALTARWYRESGWL